MKIHLKKINIARFRQRHESSVVWYLCSFYRLGTLGFLPMRLATDQNPKNLPFKKLETTVIREKRVADRVCILCNVSKKNELHLKYKIIQLCVVCNTLTVVSYPMRLRALEYYRVLLFYT